MQVNELFESIEQANKKIIDNNLKLLGNVFKKNNHEIRVVGGAVRDIALGKDPKDIDLATDATPKEMQTILDKAGIKHKPTGIEHGTITAIINKKPYEITTLRADVQTDGRRADVKFVKNWQEDAKRRDLTYNAMSMNFNGEIFDYFGGMNDLQNKVSKFVGDPEQRIKEDYLRILRYFRFQGRLDKPDFEESTLEAIKKNISGLSKLSVERIWSEIDKILGGKNIKEILDHMEKTGVLNAIGLKTNNMQSVVDNDDSLINLARIVDNDDIAKKWKFSNVEQSTLLTLVKNKNKELKKDVAEKLIASGKNKYILAKLALLQGNKQLASYIEKFDAPEFPVSGNDLIALGQKSGPELGQKLNYLKQKWMQSNFTATKDELLRSLSENKQNLDEGIFALWPYIQAAFTQLARTKGAKKAKEIMSEFIKRLPPGSSPEHVLDLIKYLAGGGTGGYIATQVSKNKKEKEKVEENKRIPRKKGQPAGSKKHSDLYTDENPKGTIHGLKFATVADAKSSVSKIRNSGRSHAHKIQAAVAMEQRAKAAGKTSAASVYRTFINAMKKKTKQKNETAGVGIVTKQNATADVPVGGEYMNVKKLKLNKKPKKSKPKNETKEAPKGHYFTKSGNLVKGKLTKDARERGARETDPKDKTRSKIPKVTQYAEATVDEIGQTSQIYVDMDGVLADFFGDWKKLVGKDWRKITDIGPALQKIRDTDNFWLNLPMTNNAKNLLNLIKGIKGSYKILSSPLPDDPKSEPHKREWIEDNLKFFPPEDVIITFDKTKFATQSDGTPNILIDDYGVNIQKWESAGGVGFKHKDHKFERTARAIKQHIDKPVEEKWSSKYKKSINCSNPKGFSQKAHCAGRKKRNENYQRSQLPQIKSYDLQYIDHEFMLLPINKVIPVQKERVMENFKKQVDRITIGQYTPIVVDCENRIVNGHHRFDAVKLLGEKYIQVAKIPHSIECLIENFADGKKKGRKGLAKRTGVNCKQSITKLRSIAKNSTGERRRMAHWCANMKSGRKKK